MCFHKRFLFTFVAHTDLDCYAIRRQEWHDIMQEFPELFRVVKHKCFEFYFNQVQRPMMQQKLMDIKGFDKRTDFSQVLTVRANTFQEMKSCVNKIFSEQEDTVKEKTQQLIEAGKINYLLSRISIKLEECIKIFVEMTQKTEFYQRNLWNLVTQNIANDKVKDPDAYVH